MKFPSFFQSEKYAHLLRYLGFAVVGLIIFGAGIFIGHKTADFSYEWSDNYYRDFGGPHSPFLDRDDMSPIPHGAFGTVIGINFPSFAVKAPHESEKVVLIGSSTLIRSIRSEASTTDIHIGSNVIIIGNPDSQGRVMATLIRIIPSSTPARLGPPNSSSSMQ